MDLEQIATDADFSTFLGQLAVRAQEYRGSQEAYLCSVLQGASTHPEDPPTWQLLVQILAEGLTTSLAPFESAWLAYIGPPEVITQITQ